MPSGSPRPSRILALLLAAGVAGCGDDAPETRPEGRAAGEPSANAYAGFCEAAMEGVGAFLAAQRAGRGEPEGPRYGGTVTVGASTDMPGMMALATTDLVANQHQMFVNLMTLVRLDESFEPRPWLAESWEVAPDGSSITFRLRDDVVWHDGERTDAFDVAFTYERATDPETAFPNPAFWDFYATGEGAVEVVDSLTVRIGMRPHAEYMDVWRTVAILPEHLLGDVPPADLRSHPYGAECPVGNGPFVFSEHRIDDRWVFEANPAFPEALGGRPYVDRYVYRVVPEQATLLTELTTGGVDMYVQASPEQAALIEEHPETELLASPSREFVFVGWNSRIPQLADARVRRAMALAVDRAGLVRDFMEGHGRVAESSVPPFHWAYARGLSSEMGYDPEAARALLDEAGWVDRDGDGVREDARGNPLHVELAINDRNQLRADIAQVLAARLAEVGVDLEPRVVDYGALLQAATTPASRDFESFILSWQHEFRVDDTDLFHSQRLDEPYQFSGIEEPRLDRYLDTLRVVVDRSEAEPLWHEYQRLVAELQPFMFLYFPDRLTGIRAWLEGVVADPRGEWAEIRGWWLEPAGREGD